MTLTAPVSCCSSSPSMRGRFEARRVWARAWRQAKNLIGAGSHGRRAGAAEPSGANNKQLLVKMPAAHVKIAAPRGGTWALCEQLAEGDQVTPALRKEALAQAASFLGGSPAVLAKLTGATAAKISALAARVAAPPASVPETSKLMAEILELAEKAAAYLESYDDKPAAKAAKKPAKAAGGLKASAKSRAAAAAAAPAKKAAAAPAKKKAVDVDAMVKELVKQAAADFEEDAVAELVKGISSIASGKKAKKAQGKKAPVKAVKAAPKKKAAAAPKKAAAAPKKVRRLARLRPRPPRAPRTHSLPPPPLHPHAPPSSLQAAAAKRK